MDCKGTTVIAIRSGGSTVIAGDGQVTLGDTIVKSGAKKVRRLAGDRVIAGFAGTTADAFTLFDRFEEKLKAERGNLLKAAVELGRTWRMDKYLQRLEALLVVADKERMLLVSGNGDVIEPEDGIIGIGSGGQYARAAAMALVQNTGLSAREIARKSLEIAAKICIYTNDQIALEEL